MIKKLELKYIQSYPMNEDTGLLIQTKTRTTSSKGKPLGYKVGRLIGVSERTGAEILFDKDDFAIDYLLEEIKPILHPLSDLTKEIEVNGEKFVPIDYLVDKMKLTIGGLSKYGILQRILNEPFILEYWAFEKMISWHFNVFNLPEELYIDINTL